MSRWAIVCVLACALAVGIAEARKAKKNKKKKRDAQEVVTRALAQRMAAVKKTESMLLTKLDTRTGEVRARVRSLYKLMRAGPAPLWVEPAERTNTVRRRGAASRILRRDFYELSLLRAELDSVQTARERLLTDKAKLAGMTWPKRRSLASPITGRIRVAAPFGGYTKRKPHRLSLTRRGMALRVKRNRPVSPVADGRIRFVGNVRGLGMTVIVEHEGFMSVIGPLSRTEVSKLQQVTTATQLGVTADRRLYIEVRLAVGAGGFPVDPAPLLKRR